MKRVKNILIMYKDVVYYIIFGILTLLINWTTYYLFYDFLKMSNVCSTILAWVIAVGFAFVTNKLWVFNSKSWNFKIIINELYKFIFARLMTGVLDVIIMYVSVDICSMNANVFKAISNAVVIVLNYSLSKLFIFAKK